MEDFETIVVSRGEIFVQSLLENWEKANQIRGALGVPLEDRWALFIQKTAQTSEDYRILSIA